MRINLKGTNIELSPEIKAYLDKRLESLQKFVPNGGQSFIVDVELGRTTRHHHAGDIFRAEINVFIGKKSFRAVSEQADLYIAIDDVKAEITRELGSDKERKISLLRRGGQKFKEFFRRLYQ